MNAPISYYYGPPCIVFPCRLRPTNLGRPSFQGEVDRRSSFNVSRFKADTSEKDEKRKDKEDNNNNDNDDDDDEDSIKIDSDFLKKLDRGRKISKVRRQWREEWERGVEGG